MVFISLVTSGIVKPLSAYTLIIGRDVYVLLTYEAAYFVIGSKTAVMQFMFELIAVTYLTQRLEKIYRKWDILLIFFASNIVGGLVTCVIDTVLNLEMRLRMYSLYVGNYAGLMGLSFLIALYRPRSREVLFVVLPWGILFPYKSKSLNICFINIGIAVGGTYYIMIPHNYICFSSIFFVAPFALIMYLLVFMHNFYMKPRAIELWI